MRYLLDEQEEYDTGVTAFRLSAEKNEFQPLQEIRVDWDGSVVYREEPALLSDNHTIVEGPERDCSYDVFGVFDTGEDEVVSYHGDLSQEMIDAFGMNYTRDFNVRSEEAWIELTTQEGVAGIGFVDSPNTPSVHDTSEIPDFDVEESILTRSIWDVWTSLVDQAEEELVQRS